MIINWEKIRPFHVFVADAIPKSMQWMYHVILPRIFSVITVGNGFPGQYFDLWPDFLVTDSLFLSR
jgi:hypothetical protein